MRARLPSANLQLVANNRANLRFTGRQVAFRRCFTRFGDFSCTLVA